MSVELIAELSTNFGNDVDLGKRFIRNFAAAGVDTIKVQVFDYRHLNPADPQYDWFKSCQLQRSDYEELRNECEKRGVQFLATGYHYDDVRLIADLGCKRIKVGSGEAREFGVAQAIRDGGFDLALVSCGLSRPRYNSLLPACIAFLGCVTRYPAPAGIAYPTLLGGAYEGWSDHSIGLDECKGAILAGAQIIEFHVQLDHQARPPKRFEKTYHEVQELRAFADESPVRKYLGRWQHGG
jgi:N,N'-diacetyllegionaminate synthase